MSLCKWKETVYCFTITHCGVSREKLPPTRSDAIKCYQSTFTLSIEPPPRVHGAASCSLPDRTVRAGPHRGFPPPPLFYHPPTPWPASSSTEQMLLTFATHAHTPPLCAGAPEHSGGHVVNKAGFVTLCVQARAVGTLATAHTARAGEC